MANVVEIILRGKDQFTKDISRAGKSMKSFRASVNALGTAMVGLGTAAGGALVALTKNSIDYVREMSDLAEIVGFSVEGFAKLAFVAESANISISDLRVGINTLNKSIATGAGNIESMQARAFAAMGISLREANGELKNNEQILKEVTNRFAGYADGAEKTALALTLLGESGARLLPLLNLGTAKIEELGSKAAPITQEMADRAKELDLNIAILKRGFIDLGLVLAERFLPLMQELTKSMTDFTAKSNAWVSSGLAVISVIETMVIGLRAIAFWFTSIGKLLGTFLGSLLGAVEQFFLRIIQNMNDLLTVMKNTAAAFDQIAHFEFDGLKDLANKNYEILKGIGRNSFDTLKTQLESGKNEMARVFNEIKRDGENLLDFSLAIKTPSTIRPPAGGLNTDLRGGAGGRTGQPLEDAPNLAAVQKQAQETSKAMLDAQQVSVEASKNLALSFQQIWANSLINVGAAFKNFGAQTLTFISDGFSTAIANVVTGSQKASEAFKALGKQMIAGLVKFGAQMVINTALALALQGTILAATTAAVAPILTAWTAAATAASIATLGGALNAGPGVIPVMAANVATAQGFAAFGGVAHGGLDFVPGERTFLLQRGERVIQPEANQDLTDFLKRGAGGGQMVTVVINLDGERIGQTVQRMTDDGRITINAKSIV